MTTTITQGFEGNFKEILPEDNTTWADLATSPFGSWANWTSWHPSPKDIQVQIDDDLGSLAANQPLLDVPHEGELSVTLKISSTGSFTGEETSIDLSTGTAQSYSTGRYYRWNITVTTDSDTTIPLLGTAESRYINELVVEVLNDVSIPAPTDSTNKTLVSTDLGYVYNVQATTLQGGLYVDEGYFIEYQTASTDSYFPTATLRTPIANTETNSPQYSSSIKKIGTHSYLHSDTQDDAITWAVTPDFNNDFTLEFWFYLPTSEDQTSDTTGTASPWLLQIENSGDTDAYLAKYDAGDNSVQFVMDVGESNITLDGGTFSRETWHHYAVSRDDTTLRLFLDGEVVDTLVLTTQTFDAVTSFGVGNHVTDKLKYYMDQLRVSDSCRYTTTFTPQTNPFTDDANTVLLVSFDNTSADDVGTDYGFTYYIERQLGGVAVVETKNPLAMRVVDYQGTAWDGTVDLVLRGLGKIQQTANGVESV
jgi:hypothetical protein